MLRFGILRAIHSNQKGCLRMSYSQWDLSYWFAFVRMHDKKRLLPDAQCVWVRIDWWAWFCSAVTIHSIFVLFLRSHLLQMTLDMIRLWLTINAIVSSRTKFTSYNGTIGKRPEDVPNFGSSCHILWHNVIMICCMQGRAICWSLFHYISCIAVWWLLANHSM